MKVLHLTNYFFPEYSGTTTRLYNILHRLPFNVQVLTSNRVVKGDIIKQVQEEYDNIAVKRLPLIFGAAGQKLPWQTFSVIRHDRKILTESVGRQQFDIIHAHNSVVFGQAAAEIKDKPFILEYHGLAHESVGGLLKGIKSYYIKNTDKTVMKKSAHIVTLTERLKEWVVRNYKMQENKITVVPNGADIKRFASTQETKKKAAELKRKLGVEGKVVMYAGIMDHINGVDSLAEIIPQVIQEKVNICFVFIGGQAGNESLKALAEKYPGNVKILGSVNYDVMPSYYEMCDVFVIPRPSTVSSETIIPLKLLEVMAMGKPVVASDVGGLKEVVKHGENGYLYSKGDNENLKKTLLKALEADNWKIGENARKTITEDYTWDKSVATLLKVYEKLV